MTERVNAPGPGRSTSEAALNEVKKRVAERNDAAQKAAKKQRGPRERLRAEMRRQDDNR